MENKEIEGKEVLDGQAHFLGKIYGVDIDIKDWKITHILLDLDKKIVEELGLKKPIVGSVKVDCPIEMVAVISDRVILNKTMDELKSIIKLRH